MVATGYDHACYLHKGKVSCWGNGGNGQLGRDSVYPSKTAVDAVGITNAVSVASGNYVTCARAADGKVWCWGANTYGQLGAGVITDKFLVPKVVVGSE